jgi:hypothetical protein
VVKSCKFIWKMSYICGNITPGMRRGGGEKIWSYTRRGPD